MNRPLANEIEYEINHSINYENIATNKCVEDDENQLEMIKKAVQDMSDMVIRTLEEKMYIKQMKMNEKMQEMILEINTQLEVLEGQEEELKNFSAGLAMFMGDLK